MSSDMNNKTPATFYCFSPPIMLATFLIEIGFALYVIWRYKMATVTRLTVAILVFLAIFQGTEFLLCGGLGLEGGFWSRLGYLSITTLPPLGLHLAYAIAGKKSRFLVPFAYATGIAFILYFAFASTAISGATCYANYVVFDTNSNSSLLYGLYYYGWLFIGVLSSVRLAQNITKKREQGLKRALYALAIGYLAFMLPTTVVNLIDPSTIAGIPSIMCGFAVILAFVLTLKVTPEAVKPKDNRRSLRLNLFR